MRRVPYPHPGEILLEEFLKPMGITQYRLAKEIGVPQRRIGEIVAGNRSVTPDTGLRLSRFFGMSENFLDRSPDGLRRRKRQRSFVENTRKDQAMANAGNRYGLSESLRRDMKCGLTVLRLSAE